MRVDVSPPAGASDHKDLTENYFTINDKMLNLVLLFKFSGLPRRYASRNDGEMPTGPISRDQVIIFIPIKINNLQRQINA